MSESDFTLDFDDDLSHVPATPTPSEVPSHVRELLRVVAGHARQHRTLRRLIWSVVGAVALGSFTVVGAVAGAAWYLGARMERLESITWRVERLERAMEDRHADDR